MNRKIWGRWQERPTRPAHDKTRGHPRRLRWAKAIVLLLVYAAYTLQTTTLTLQSLWIDEVMALEFTKGSLTETIHTIVQPQHNGPLYYLLLFGWRHLVGDSDLAVRFLSVLCATLTMPLLFQWARRALTDDTAVAAVCLFAISPFTLWFAQEAKMYALHMMLSTASSLALLEAFRKGRWWRWLLYAPLASALLYSHLFGAFLVVAQALMALLLGCHKPRRLLAYAATMLALGLTHTPLARFAWLTLRFYQPRDIWRVGFVPLHDIFRDLVGSYFYRFTLADLSWPALLLGGALILTGVLGLLLRREAKSITLLLHAFAPVLIFYPISFRVPVYAAKYLAATLPAFFILAAWGGKVLFRLWRPASVSLAVLAALMIGGDVRDLTNPAFQRSDWRFAADYVDAHESANDIVMISAFYATHAFQRYYNGSAQVVGFEANPYDPLPFYQYRAGNCDHMWLILHHDQAMAPGNQLQEAANTAFPVMTAQFPNAGQIHLIGYQIRLSYPTLPPAAHPLDVCFQNGVCLAGYWLDAVSLPATERLSHPPSNWIHAALYWRREAQVDSTPFRPLVRVVDRSFDVWGGNMDRRPDVLDRYPPGDWETDAVIETHFDLNLNPVTPEGTYSLEVSLAIEGDENRRVTVVNAPPGMPADRFLFETITIRQ